METLFIITHKAYNKRPFIIQSRYERPENFIADEWQVHKGFSTALTALAYDVFKDVLREWEDCHI